MPRVIKSRESQDDYLEIWLYVARDKAEAADALVAHFDQQLDLLASAPLIGKLEEDLATEIRSFPIGKYIVYFRIIEGGVELVRILHSARDITSDFFTE